MLQEKRREKEREKGVEKKGAIERDKEKGESGGVKGWCSKSVDDD